MITLIQTPIQDAVVSRRPSCSCAFQSVCSPRHEFLQSVAEPVIALTLARASPDRRRVTVKTSGHLDPWISQGTQVYIGETDDAAPRLALHNRPEDKGGKGFWERVCVVTSKDANLTKGHIK